MPIRFRCAYCNQLMGISHRKLGTVVRCPTCAGQVVVPNPDAPASPPPVEKKGTSAKPEKQEKPGPNLFEQSDIDDLLRPNVQGTVPAGKQAPAPPPPGAWGTNIEALIDIDRVDEVVVAPPAPPGGKPAMGIPSPTGIVLSPSKATLLAVIAVLLIGIAFGGGVLVGKFLL